MYIAMYRFVYLVLTGLVFGQLFIGQAFAIEPVNETQPVCGLNLSAQNLAQLIMTHPSQKRPVLKCNSQLANIAQQRAEDLAKNTADPDITPNQVVAKGGFRFPDYYPVTGNQVEAVAESITVADKALQYMVNSNQHHDHILGKGDFFEIQTELAVGFYTDDDIAHAAQWVVLISQAWESPKIIYSQKFAEPKIRDVVKCGKNWRHSGNENMRRKCKKQAAEQKAKQ